MHIIVELSIVKKFHASNFVLYLPKDLGVKSLCGVFVTKQ